MKIQTLSEIIAELEQSLDDSQTENESLRDKVKRLSAENEQLRQYLANGVSRVGKEEK